MAEGPVTGPLEPGLRAVAGLLERERVPYMVIGGVAVSIWGVPRATFDVDFTVWAPGRREVDLVRKLASAFRSRVPEPEAFVRDCRVFPLTADGTPIDVAFGALPFEDAAIRRARDVDLGGWKIRVCSPEDIIVQKSVSDRLKDQEDARKLIEAHRDGLDRKYLEPLLKSLALELSRPAIWADYEASLRA